MTIETSIKVASCTLDELFNNKLSNYGINGLLSIPEYQRPYKWSKIEIEKLLNDIQEHFSDVSLMTPDYYLGTIILHQQNGNLNIIDGQQRLTTMGIIFNLLGELVKICYNSPFSIQVIKNNTAILKRKLTTLNNLKDKILSRINITLVITPTEDEAYSFFETQNTGGVRLRGVDIIKAYHLRAIDKEKDRSLYAIKWESQKEVDMIVKMLLKARWWNKLFWCNVPGRLDEIGLKRAVIKEFSESVNEKGRTNISYQLVELLKVDNRINVSLPECIHHIRQPINAGENFIEFLCSFCLIYENVFLNKKLALFDKELSEFFDKIIFNEDGTKFLKWLFELCMLCYVHRFGSKNLLEASFWIFRCTFSMRVSHEKTVREDSIPKFVDDYPIIEYILNSFSPKDCIDIIKKFNYNINEKNTEGNTVKSRYIERVSDFFKFENSYISFDKNLIESIEKKLKNYEIYN